MDVEQDDFRKKILIKSKWLDLYMAPAKLLLAAKVLEAFADCRRQGKPAKAAKENGEIGPLYDHNLCNFDDNTVIKMIWGIFFQAMFIFTLILTFNFMASNHMAKIQ